MRIQVVVATLAWLNLPDDGSLILEVAEDYAIIANEALQPVQVKDTARSGAVTLVSESVVRAIESFVSFANRYADRQIEFHFVTTSEIGTEHAIRDRPAGSAGLKYWKRVSGRASSEEIEPLRVILESDRFSESVRRFSTERDNKTLHRDLIQRIKWECGRGDISWIREELEAGLVVLGRDRFHLPAPEARRLADHLIYEVLKRSIEKTPSNRVLSRADLYSAIDVETQVTVSRATLESVLARAALSQVGVLSGDSPAVTEARCCHRVVRHLVLWMLSRMGPGARSAEGTAITVEAGACSNPDPSPTIRERPLAHIDIVWYMLARVEATLGVDVGIRNTLEDRLKQGSTERRYSSCGCECALSTGG